MVLFGTAVVTGGMLLWPLVNRLIAGTAPQVGALAAVQLINRRDAVVLDVRDKADYAAGHIPNARKAVSCSIFPRGQPSTTKI